MASKLLFINHLSYLSVSFGESDTTIRKLLVTQGLTKEVFQNMKEIESFCLDWDSDFFGFGVAKINVEDLNESLVASEIECLQKDGFELIYIFSKHPLSLSGQNAMLVDQKRSYILPNPIFKPTERTVLSVTRDPEKLYELAWQAGEYSRYKIDPMISDNDFKRLYRLWADNSVSGQFADHVLACKDGDTYCGFITAKEKGNIMSIGLIATDSRFRRKGIGTTLIQEIKNKASIKNLAVEVTTQADNIPACAFYECNGFKIDHQEYIYHVWPNKPHNGRIRKYL